MNGKIPFSKLKKTPGITISHWEYLSPEGIGHYIQYEQDDFTVYVSKEPISEIKDCIVEKNLVLSVEDLLGVPACGHMTDEVLFEILSSFKLLENE